MGEVEGYLWMRRRATAVGRCDKRGGGGGGGEYRLGTGQAGGAGGSGVVVLKYSAGFTITIGAGLTGSTSAPSGGYVVSTITAGTGNVSWA